MANLKKFCQKLYRWEFWPAHVFMMPIYAYGLIRGTLMGRTFFFTAVNPGMHQGGLDEEKFRISEHFPDKLVPKSVLIQAKTDTKTRDQKIRQKKISYPCIVKPNIGLRGNGLNGLGVEKIYNQKELEAYFKHAQEDIIVQEFIDSPFEFGIMYARKPWEKNGHVTSVMQREFLTITGDGKSSLKKLIKKHSRGKFYTKDLLKRYRSDLDQVLKKDEKKLLVPIGNHCRGTQFNDADHLIGSELSKAFDKVSKNFDGFFYGRYDVKADSVEDLKKGRVKILELNGFNSEPAHIYDPKNSLIKAYKDYFWHVKLFCDIAEYNIKKNNAKYPNFREGLKLIQKYW